MAINSMQNNLIQSLTTTLLEQHRQIIAGSDLGLIFIWDLSSDKPISYSFQADSTGILTLKFSSDGTRLITGSYTSVSIQNFPLIIDNLKNSLSKTCTEEFCLGKIQHSPKECFGSIETNDMCVYENYLFCATGLNYVFVYDLNTNKVVEKLFGHTDYLLSLDKSLSHRLVSSAGVDGTLRFQDIRDSSIGKQHSQAFGAPFNNNECDQKDLSKAIMALKIDNQYENGHTLVCGGKQQKVVKQNLTTMSLQCLMDTNSKEIAGCDVQALAFGGPSQILVGGNDNFIYQFNRSNGNLTARTPTSAHCSVQSILPIPGNPTSPYSSGDIFAICGNNSYAKYECLNSVVDLYSIDKPGERLGILECDAY